MIATLKRLYDNWWSERSLRRYDRGYDYVCRAMQRSPSDATRTALEYEAGEEPHDMFNIGMQDALSNRPRRTT